MEVLKSWEATKDWLAATLHVTHWTIHAVIGVVLLVVFAKLLRLPLRSPWALLPIAVLEALNETLDFLRFHLSHWHWTPRPTLIEAALTLAPPALVVIVARLASARDPASGTTAG